VNLFYFHVDGMSDLQHLPLCDLEEEVVPFEFVPPHENTDENNHKTAGQSKAPNILRPYGTAVVRSGTH
jgi:hypothetical protein